MNTGCFKCDKAQWDADGCTCEITGLLVGNAERDCEYRKDIELKPCPFCDGKAANCTKQYDGRIYRYRIQCDNAGCACRTPWLCYQEDAVEVWNRRTKNDTREENKVLTSECDRLIKEKGELLSKASSGDVLKICQLEEQLKDWKEEYANLNKISYDYYKELKEAKRLLKSAIDEWNLVCEWGNCGEYCGWYENGKCTQEWSGKAEALKLLND